jgi:hypothetical protein
LSTITDGSAPVAAAERLTRAGQSGAMLVLLKASTGILEAARRWFSAGVSRSSESCTAGQ